MPQFFYDAKGAHKEKQSDCRLLSKSGTRSSRSSSSLGAVREQWFHGQHQGGGSCRWSTTDIGVVAAATIRWHGVCMGMHNHSSTTLRGLSNNRRVRDSFGTNIAVRLSARRSIRGATSRKGRSGIIGEALLRETTASSAVSGAIGCILTRARSTDIAECLASSFLTGEMV